MKFILLVATMMLDGDGGRAASEATAAYGTETACTKAVEIRTGQGMQATRGGYRLIVNINNHSGQRIGQTTYVCSPYATDN